MRNPNNLTPMFFYKAEEFSTRFPEYTIGQILYSMLAQLSKKGFDVDKKSSLLDIKDDDFYSAISRAMSNEVDENL